LIVAVPWAIDGGWLGSTGRTPSCLPVKAPILDSISVSCTSTGTALGPIGSGVLAKNRIAAAAVYPRVGSRAATMSAVVLTDATGTAIPANSANGTIRPVRCPDFDGNGNVNSTGDFVSLANAIFKNLNPQAVHDMDINGTLNSTGDLVAAAQLTFASQPQPLRCAPFGAW
jgi:hypothetical protein